MEYEPPVLEGHIPFLLNIHQREVNCLLGSNIVSKLDLGFDVFPDTPIDVLNGVGGIDDFSDLQREGEVVGQILPVITPGLDCVPVFALPFIDLLQISAELFAILPDHISAAIADLMYDA